MIIKIRRLSTVDAAISSPYAAKDDVRALLGAFWDTSLKVWLIPSSTVSAAAAELRGLGYEVVVTGYAAPAATSVPEPWEALFYAVPVALRTKTFHALSKVLHPDAGGNLAAMQGLTRAYSKIGH